MLKINPDLQQKIKELLQADAKADEDTVIEALANMPALRLKKESISKGVREYFKSRVRQTKPPNSADNPEVIIDKLKKKVKKSELQIEFQDHPSFKFQNLGGISSTLQQIETYILLPIRQAAFVKKLGTIPTKGFLLTGHLGSGKTLLANCILSHLLNQFKFSAYSLHCGCLLSNDSEDQMKKLFEAASENQPSIILLDDIDLLCSKESSKRPQGSPVSYLMSQMQKARLEDIYFLGTTSNPEKIDVNIKKLDRFEKVIQIKTSTDICRQEILSKLLKDVPNAIEANELLELSKMTSGYMAADLMVLIKEATIQLLLESQQKSQTECLLKAEHLVKSLRLVQPVMKKEGFTDIPNTSLDDVGGMKEIIMKLERQIIIPMKEQAKIEQINFGIRSGGVLLYGPPGCGKTMLAKAIANEVRANFIIVKGPELLNKYVGESEQAVREVFGRAQRASPCIIFFDEFDALAPKRSDQGNQVTERVVNTLLAAMDGVQERKMVFVIAATNRKDMIDEATLRSGRIQKHIYVPYPTAEERADILKAICKNMRLEDGIDFSQIAMKSEGFSGADLKFLVKQATVSAVMEGRKMVGQADLDKAYHQLHKSKQEGRSIGKDLEQSQENEKYEYMFQPRRDQKIVARQRQSNKAGHSNMVMEEFMRFLSSRISRP